MPPKAFMVQLPHQLQTSSLPQFTPEGLENRDSRDITWPALCKLLRKVK